MPVITEFAIALYFALLGLAFPAPAAQPSEPAPAALMTVEQARGAFVAAGFHVDQSVGWEWTSPPVSTFHVQDRIGDDRAMVLVYPTPGAAELARVHGGTLVVGYGASVWRDNVAIVQADKVELDRIYRGQNECDNGVLPDNAVLVAESAATPIGVDLDLQQALGIGALHL